MGNRIKAASLLACSALLVDGVAPSLAHATAQLPGSPTGALHVGKKALDLIGKIALERVPTHMDLPPLSKDLTDICPNGPMTMQVSQAYVDLTPKSLTFTPAEGALGLDALLDIEGFVHVEIPRGYACLGTASCDIAFSAHDLNPKAALELSITNGKPTAGLGAVSATVPAGQLHVSFANCILDNLSSGLVDKASAAILQIAQKPLGDKLRELVPPLIESQLSSMLGASGNVVGYGFNAAVTDVKMTADGIDAYAAIGVDFEGAAAACLPPDAPMGATTPRNPTAAGATLALPTGPSSSVVIGVSTDLLSSALSAAWQSGMLCTDDAAIAKLGFDPNKLASLVPGLPAGMTMHFAMGLDQPPTITVDGAGGVRMKVVGAELLLSMSVPGQQPSGVALATDFTVGVKPSVDPASGSIYAELTDLSMERMELHAGASATQYAMDPERLTVLMRDVVLPMAAQRLRGMPLSPAAFGAQGVYAWLTELSSRNGGVFVGLEPFRPGPARDDTQAPDTMFQKTPGKLVRAGLARFTVGGTDDQTPPELLRYEWQVDDGALSAPSFQKVISAPVTTSGSHTFRVRAIDLADKPSTGFQTYTFDLDPVPPVLTILEQPEVALRATSATIKLSGTDDRSAPNLLSFAYRVEAREPGGEMKLIASAEPSGLENGVGEIKIEKIVTDTLYDVTVLLFDEAGNVTSQKIGFGAASPGGCSMATSPRSQNPAAGFLFLLAAVLLLVRRRARVLG